MAHIAEIAVNAVNVGISLTILVLLLSIARDSIRQGLDVVSARLFLRKKEAMWGMLFVLGGLVVFLGSNLLELYGDVFHIDWVVNEAVETLALVPMAVGLVQYHLILRLPSKAARSGTFEVGEAPPR